MRNLTAATSAATDRKRRALSPRVTLIVAATCAIAMVWLSENAHRRMTDVIVELQNTHSVRTSINTLVRDLVVAESSQRGFLLTGDSQYLAPYQKAVTGMVGQLKQLDIRAPQAMRESDAMVSFKTLLAQKLGEMSLTLRMREQDRPEVANFVISSNVGLEQMEAFRQQSDALAAQVEALVASKRGELHQLLNVARFGLVVGVLAALLAFVLYVRQARTLQQADIRQQRLLEAERDALESQVRERTLRLTELATHLQQAVEDERAHLARELHDELGALLTAAKLDIARLKSHLASDADDATTRLDHLNKTLNQVIALKRRIIEDLRPSSLSILGLVASLEILVREFSERSGIDVQTVLEPVDLDAARELTIYRLVQEALTNIGKYANPTKVTVTLKNYVYHAEVSVVDDGVGFDATRLPQASHGLVGMHHRVEASGGRLDLDSEPGRGTRITGTIPRRQAKPQRALAEAMDAMDAVSAQSYGARKPALTPPDADR